MKKKNLTPFQLALLSSAILSVLFICILITEFLFEKLPDIWFIIIAFLMAFVLSFLVFYFVLQIFIYRKIKLIYKSIHHIKSTKEVAPQKIQLTRDVIGEVEEQVAHWKEDYQNEINTLIKNEQYRREFLTNVSHELKSPLFNAQGYIQTLIDNKLSDEEINLKYLKKAAQNLEKLGEIITDLEIISRLENGELQLVYTKFDIRDLIEEIMFNLEIQTIKKNISLGFKEGCDTPFHVYADKEQISRVLNNLIVNAIRYGKENGSVKIGLYDMGDNILVEVSDDGIGIEKEHLPRVFERFFRVDKSHDRKESGSGLGLAIVKHIIECHRQTINVRSTPGVGSTFGFTLKKA